VISEQAHRRKVQTVGQQLDDFPCYFVKSRCIARFIRQYNAKEYGPIATPILTDIVPDVTTSGANSLRTSETAELISGCLAMAGGKFIPPALRILPNVEDSAVCMGPTRAYSHSIRSPGNSGRRNAFLASKGTGILAN